MKHRVLTMAVVAAVLFSAALPASALFLDQSEAAPAVAPISKNGLITESITFSTEDFLVEEGGAELDSIVLTSLPDPGTGVLTLGGQVVGTGDIIAMAAVDGLKFTPASAPTEAEVHFQFTPVFADGQSGTQVDVELYLLDEENGAPVAENLTLSTYKNVAITAQFAAVDPEGDLLTYYIVKKPARGEVTMPEDGSTEFVYTPYENKTGKDTFTYVAVDAVGNTSDPATVKIQIEKQTTKVTYADMDGNPAQKAAIRLAEEGIFVGECMDGQYFFQPDMSVTRSAFVAMAMQVAGLDALEGVTRTGFADDEAIPTWAKPYVSSALKSGVVQGTQAADGQIVFQADASITAAEAAVILDRALQVTDVSADTLAGADVPTWAVQAAANLSSCGMLPTESDLSSAMTRAEAAELLCSALELMDSRSSGWFS